MSTASSSAARNSGDAVFDQFPAGLRVLVVDDDRTCLVILEKMLRTCLYEVTKCNRAETALSLLRENRNGFDIVLSDVHMPDMDGFKLLEHIGLEMDLPVIMMSADDEKNVVMKGVTHGACDYLIKPVRIDSLKNIWQHVVRKRKNERKDVEQSGSVEEGNRQHKASDDGDYSSSANEGTWRSTKKRRDEEEESEEKDDTSTLKKPRVVWSVELHQQFMAAVNQLGLDKAVPKKILELMNVPGLTRENVASHLQKYRLYLRRVSGVSQNQGSNSFLSPQEAAFGVTSINGIDLQTLSAASPFPAQSLATLQTTGLGRPDGPIPLVDQRNQLFSFENPRLRFGEVKQQHLSSGYKPVNLLHGIPTNLEPKQLPNLHQSNQTLGNLNMRVNASAAQKSPLLEQMGQSHPSGHMLSENITGSNVLGLPSTLGQPNVLSGISSGLQGRNGISGTSNRTSAYNPVMQNSSVLNFPMNQSPEMSVNSFPFGSTPCVSGSDITMTGMFNEEVTTGIKGSGGFVPSYDIFNDLQHQKSHGWELTNVGMPFDASHHVNPLQGNNIAVSPSVLVHQGFPSIQHTGRNRDATVIGKDTFSLGEGMNQGNLQTDGQHLDMLLLDNSSRIKVERIPDPNFPGHYYGQEDLMTSLLKQQEGIGQVDVEFDLDGYSLDNIPV